MQYLMQLRIQKAAQLLLNSNDMIHTISEEVGLRTPSYFIRQFKKATGLTPIQYRIHYSIPAQQEKSH